MVNIIDAGFIINLSPGDEIKIMENIERAGRTAYKSEANITSGSAKDFVEMLINRGHESVLEHECVSVRVICDRGVSHEIVRHRIASYSQESTRYCNYSKEKFGNQITVIDIRKYLKDDEYDDWIEAVENTEIHYFELLRKTGSPQLARSVLPNSLKTEILITMNLREWRHFFRLRTAKAAHPQMREIAIPMLNEFKGILPAVFDDIKVIE